MIDILEAIEIFKKTHVSVELGDAIEVTICALERQPLLFAEVERLQKWVNDLKIMVKKLQEGNDYARELLDKQIERNEGLANHITKLRAENRMLKSERDKAYRDGADYAFYELCKEADIPSADICKSGDTIDGIAASLARRINGLEESV